MSDDDLSDDERQCCFVSPVTHPKSEHWKKHFNGPVTIGMPQQGLHMLIRWQRRLLRLISALLSLVFCAPSTAMHCMIAGLPPVKARHTSFKYRWAIEWSTEAQWELTVLPVPPEQMFGDILKFLTEKAEQELNSLGPEPHLADKEKIILHSKHAIKKSMPSSRLHIAGTPRTDFST